MTGMCTVGVNSEKAGHSAQNVARSSSIMQPSVSFGPAASIPRHCVGARKLSAAVKASDSHGTNIAKYDILKLN
jgi:hypothetical protein